ncbi:biotin/lipoyl-binding protein [Pseudomonas aeruginosa]
MKKRPWRRPALIILSFVIVASAVVTAMLLDKKPANPNPPVVRTAMITTRDVPTLLLDNVGNVVPSVALTVRAQVQGALTSINFDEGQAVAYGDLLAKVDDRALATAEGALLRDRTQLDDAHRDLERMRRLVDISLASRQQLDVQATEVQQAEGLVRARLRSLKGLRTQLINTRITAPIDGIVGPWATAVGDFVQPADANGVVTLVGLLPNQFVNANIRVQMLRDAMVVPMLAIRYGSQGPYVLAVSKGKVRLQHIRTGPTLDNYGVIDADALKPGMLVVVDGSQSLEDGAAVHMMASALAEP